MPSELCLTMYSLLLFTDVIEIGKLATFIVALDVVKLMLELLLFGLCDDGGGVVIDGIVVKSVPDNDVGAVDDVGDASDVGESSLT